MGMSSGGKNGPIGDLVNQLTPMNPDNPNQSSFKPVVYPGQSQIAPRAPDPQNPIGISQQEQNGSYSGMPNQPMGKGGTVTTPATSGQPRIGQPNLYPNTVGMGDNTQQKPNQAQAKGKGV